MRLREDLGVEELQKSAIVLAPVVAGEIGNLALPEARMPDGPCRQEQNGRRAVPVNLVGRAHAAALDISLLVRISSPHQRVLIVSSTGRPIMAIEWRVLPDSSPAICNAARRALSRGTSR